MKPLIFRNDTYGNGYARRNNVKYSIQYSRQNKKYHVWRLDLNTYESISTKDVREFQNESEAKQFCQDMFEGKVDLSALKTEIAKLKAEKERKDNTFKPVKIQFEVSIDEASYEKIDEIRKQILGDKCTTEEFINLCCKEKASTKYILDTAEFKKIDNKRLKKISMPNNRDV